MNIGYVRVSSFEQHMDRQLGGIQLDKIYRDTISGKDTERPELKKCLACLKEGDVLHVHSIDRLTRNLRDLLRLLEEMATRGVTVRFHKEKLTFTSDTSPFQKLHLHYYYLEQYTRLLRKHNSFHLNVFLSELPIQLALPLDLCLLQFLLH